MKIDDTFMFLQSDRLALVIILLMLHFLTRTSQIKSGFDLLLQCLNFFLYGFQALIDRHDPAFIFVPAFEFKPAFIQ